MKRTLTILLTVMVSCYSMSIHAQDVETFVGGLLKQYPKARLLDIYKSSFQDYMGAEHLVNDTASVKAYLEQELATTDTSDLMAWYYEPCGVNGNYVRVSLRAVKEGIITADALLNAFIASANGERPAVESWASRWHEMVSAIDRMELTLPHYEQDRQFIEEVLAMGKYAISHSPDYRDAYSPHYRIVRCDIFERDLKPLLPPQCCCHP